LLNPITKYLNEEIQEGQVKQLAPVASKHDPNEEIKDIDSSPPS